MVFFYGRLLEKFSLLLLEQRRKEGGNESDGYLEEELQEENVQRPCVMMSGESSRSCIKGSGA